jgi:pyrroline-5-carboxylate reductase
MNRKINKTIAFLGAGNMAEALIRGIVKSKLFYKQRVVATDVRVDRCIEISRQYGIITIENSRQAAKNADIIVLAVKPQQLEPLLKDISPVVRKKSLVISIAAGVTIKSIEKHLLGVPVIRTMPNTPAMVGAGVIAMAAGSKAVSAHLRLAQDIFSSVATTIVLKESDLNAVTAISGSGPAYIFRIAEILETAGKKIGLKSDVAALLARGTVFGAGKMLHDLQVPASELRRNVTSPGGTTEAALKCMDNAGLEDILTKAVFCAHKRAGELSK